MICDRSRSPILSKLGEGREITRSVSMSLRCLARSFGDTGNVTVADRLEMYADMLDEGIEMMNNAFDDQSNESLQRAKQQCGGILSMLMERADKDQREVT